MINLSHFANQQIKIYQTHTRDPIQGEWGASIEIAGTLHTATRHHPFDAVSALLLSVHSWLDDRSQFSSPPPPYDQAKI